MTRGKNELKAGSPAKSSHFELDPKLQYIILDFWTVIFRTVTWIVDLVLQRRCTMTKLVQDFVEKIVSDTDSDYGDFMRRANLYLLELRDECRRLGHAELESKFREMQNYVQFSPIWWSKPVRQRLMLDAAYIDRFLTDPLRPKRTVSNSKLTVEKKEENSFQQIWRAQSPLVRN